MSASPPLLDSATKIELQSHKGKDITWEMTVLNIEDEATVDITGASVIFSVKEKVSDAAALFTRSVGSGIVINVDQINNKGKFQLSLVPANTASLDPGTYQCDVEITLSGKEQTPGRGTLAILDVVTNL